MSAQVVTATRASTALWWVAVSLLAALALAGVARVPGLVLAAGAGESEARVSVETGSGLVTLAGYELLDGPSPEELGGVTHGIGGYVDSGHALVRVHLTVIGNGSVVPAESFRLLRPDGDVQAPDAHTLPALELLDGAALDASLSFVVPRQSGTFALRVRDAVAAVDLTLGDVDAPPRPSAHQH